MTATASSSAPPASTPPAAAKGSAPASSGGLSGIENALGGPKRAMAIGAAVLVALIALYERHKANSSSSSSTAAQPDAGATTDMNSLPDWEFLYEQQQQGTNPVPPPTTVSTLPPVAPTPTPPASKPPVEQGGNPPHSSTPPVKASSPPKSSSPQLTQTYTVKKGDTLWGIAKKYLGNGADYNTIYQANKGVIGSNPNLIKPGEKLKV